jgi:hypothetical protein
MSLLWKYCEGSFVRIASRVVAVGYESEEPVGGRYKEYLCRHRRRRPHPRRCHRQYHLLYISSRRCVLKPALSSLKP